MAETKVCENCETEVGIAEVKCPKCEVTFADLEDAIVTVERANKILAARKAKATPPTPEVIPPTPTTAPPEKKKILASLGKVIRKP